MAIVYSDMNNYEKALGKGVSLLVFYADWCGPCKMLHPVLEELDKDGQKVVKVNSDENPELMMRFGLQGVPSMIIYQDGVPKEKASGYLPKVQLEGWIKKFQ